VIVVVGPAAVVVVVAVDVCVLVDVLDTVTVVPGAVLVTVVPGAVLVVVFVVFGRRSKSPPKPSPTPTTPTAARAPAHFSNPRLETSLTFSLAGSESVKKRHLVLNKTLVSYRTNERGNLSRQFF
jgi:hypothetical protein